MTYVKSLLFDYLVKELGHSEVAAEEKWLRGYTSCSKISVHSTRKERAKEMHPYGSAETQ